MATRREGVDVARCVGGTQRAGIIRCVGSDVGRPGVRMARCIRPVAGYGWSGV